MARLEIKHQMRAEDVAAVCEMLEVAAQVDGHPPLSEHHVLDLVHRDAQNFAAVVAWQDGHDHPIAYAQMIREIADLWDLQYVVDPHYRNVEPGAGTAVVEAALDVIRASGGGRVRMWVPKRTDDDVALASSLGMRPERQLQQLRRTLPHEERSSLPVRAFVPGMDGPAWLEVNNRAFAGHPDQGGWDRATLASRQGQRWFDPSGFLLHERDGRLAGYCWTKIHSHHDPHLGEIYVLGVDPDFQGQGLGRELVLRGLEWLSERAIPTAMLYVDAGNRPALRLYESLGFVLDHVDQAYVADLAPVAGAGTDQPTLPTPTAEPTA